MSQPSSFTILRSLAQNAFTVESNVDGWEQLALQWNVVDKIVVKVLGEAERIHEAEKENSLHALDEHWKAQVEKRDAIIRNYEQLILAALRGSR